MGENARKQAIKNQQLFTSKDKQFQHIEISEKTNQIYSYICNSKKAPLKRMEYREVENQTPQSPQDSKVYNKPLSVRIEHQQSQTKIYCYTE